MKEENEYPRMHFSFSKCVVCSSPCASRTGYLFMANGKSVVGMPYCKQHLAEAGIILANPVFENEEALQVFRSLHPGKYAKHVKGKRAIFLATEH